MLKNKMIAFLGAGTMAEAMISGIVKSGKIPLNQVIVSNNSNTKRLQHLEKVYGINGVTKENLNFEEIDMLILAMKPKDVKTAIQSIRHSLQPHQIVLSVIAGISTSFIEDLSPSGQQVVRVMPNTSSMIGESATAISFGKYSSEQNNTLSKKLFECIGEVYVLPEKNMDISTAIAGSGPAYFYYLMEYMEKEGIRGGLTEEITRQIITQTMLGAAKMIQQQGETPSILKEKVTSLNGTTAAGLSAIEANGGGIAISEAIKQATHRSKEISSQLVNELQVNE